MEKEITAALWAYVAWEGLLCKMQNRMSHITKHTMLSAETHCLPYIKYHHCYVYLQVPFINNTLYYSIRQKLTQTILKK